MDNFKIIYKILTALEAAMDLPAFDMSQISHESMGVSQERWARYMEMMVDLELVKGARISRNIADETQVENRNLRITLKGLEYLTENSIMQRIYKAAKGIKEILPGL